MDPLALGDLAQRGRSPGDVRGGDHRPNAEPLSEDRGAPRLPAPDPDRPPEGGRGSRSARAGSRTGPIERDRRARGLRSPPSAGRPTPAVKAGARATTSPVRGADALEQVDEHRRRQFSGLRVLRARVERSPQEQASRVPGPRRRRERMRWPGDRRNRPGQRSPGVASHANPPNARIARVSVRSRSSRSRYVRAVRPLARQRLVSRGGAADGGREVEIGVPKAVGAAQGGSLVREPREVECTDQERRRPIAREDAARAIGSVRRGGEPDRDQPSARVAESGNPAAPVVVGAELALLLARHPRSILDESGAARARDDFRANPVERILHDRPTPSKNMA